MTGTCGTCRHWQPPAVEEYGECTRISRADAPALIEVHDRPAPGARFKSARPGCDVGLLTLAEFGCRLHEPREAQP